VFHEPQQHFQENLGIDAGFISFLAQGGNAVKEDIARQEELGLITEEDAQAVRAFNKATGE